MNIRQLSATAFTAGALFIAQHTHAETPGRSTEFSDALVDLKAAQYNLSHAPRADPVSRDEKTALTDINRALDAARSAAADETEAASFSPPEEMPARTERLEQTAGLLERAKVHLQQAENDHHARQALRRVEENLDHGLHAVEMAIEDAHRARR